MAKQTINIGTSANDSTGDPLRTAFGKANSNITEIYNALGDGSAITLTSTAAELNILDGAILSTTELNYVDGVTSAIQTQLDAKSPTAGSSSITTLGTIATGVWNGTAIAGQYGGTGVANTGKTITLGGNLTTSGAHATTLTTTGTTGVTLPTTGTLATLDGTETFTNKTAGVATATSTAASLGYLGVPQNSRAADYTTVIGDAGKHIYVTSTATITIDSNANVAYPIGTTIQFIAATGATVTIAITTDTMYLAGTGTTGSRTLAAFGMATAVKVAATIWFISGFGLT